MGDEDDYDWGNDGYYDEDGNWWWYDDEGGEDDDWAGWYQNDEGEWLWADPEEDEEDKEKEEKEKAEKEKEEKEKAEKEKEEKEREEKEKADKEREEEEEKRKAEEEEAKRKEEEEKEPEKPATPPPEPELEPVPEASPPPEEPPPEPEVVVEEDEELLRELPPEKEPFVLTRLHKIIIAVIAALLVVGIIVIILVLVVFKPNPCSYDSTLTFYGPPKQLFQLLHLKCEEKPVIGAKGADFLLSDDTGEYETPPSLFPKTSVSAATTFQVSYQQLVLYDWANETRLRFPTVLTSGIDQLAATDPALLVNMMKLYSFAGTESLYSWTSGSGWTQTLDSTVRDVISSGNTATAVPFSTSITGWNHPTHSVDNSLNLNQYLLYLIIAAEASTTASAKRVEAAKADRNVRITSIILIVQHLDQAAITDQQAVQTRIDASEVHLFCLFINSDAAAATKAQERLKPLCKAGYFEYVGSDASGLLAKYTELQKAVAELTEGWYLLGTCSPRRGEGELKLKVQYVGDDAKPVHETRYAPDNFLKSSVVCTDTQFPNPFEVNGVVRAGVSSLPILVVWGLALLWLTY